jgi:hypothetical protein
VVDDASTEDAVGEITNWARDADVPFSVVAGQALDSARNLSWLTIAASERNAGFVDSCNLGLRYVRDRTHAPYVLLLNNDAAVSPSYFSDLAAAVAARPDGGMFTGTIYEWDRRTVWYAGARFNPLRALATHDTVLPDSDEPRTTGYVCGCTMLISRKVLEKVGVIAECFRPIYVEDVDYSLRVRAAGFPLIYAPRAVCYHRVGTTLGRTVQSARTVFGVNRNRAFALRRNYRGWKKAIGVAYLAITKPGRAVVELARGRPKVAIAVVKGMATGLLSPAAHES